MTFCRGEYKNKHGRVVPCPVYQCSNSNDTDWCCWHNPSPRFIGNDVTDPPCDHKCGYYGCDHMDCENVACVEIDDQDNSSDQVLPYQVCYEHLYGLAKAINIYLGEVPNLNIPTTWYERLGLDEEGNLVR